MFRRVAIQGLKGIGDEVALELAPLTILVGKNGVGKSTILEGIALAVQSSRPLMRFGLQSEGRLVALDMSAIAHQRDPKTRLRIEVTHGPNADAPTCWFEVAGESAGAVGAWRQGLRSGSGKYSVEFRTVLDAPNRTRVEAAMRGETIGVHQVRGEVARFLDQGLFVGHGPDLNTELTAWSVVADNLAGAFASNSIRFVSAVRGAMLMQTHSQGSPTAAGRFGEDTVRLLGTQWLKAAGDRRAWLSETATCFGLPQLIPGFAGNGLVDATYEDPVTHTKLSIPSAGSASQSALPILADLMSLPAGGTLLVEEIEHSSHPEWVALWGRTLANAVRKLGVQVIATTHAPDLVLSIAVAVKRGILKAKDVAIWEVSRTDQVSARRWKLDDKGRFPEGWIDTFASAERALANELLAEEEHEQAKAAPRKTKPRRRAS